MQLQCNPSLNFRFLMLVFLATCSGKPHSSRDSSAADKESDASVGQKPGETRVSDENEGVPGFQNSEPPIPIFGTNLVEVKVQVPRCNEVASCSIAFMSATVTVGTADPVPFAISTKSSLGIKSSSWTFQSPDVICDSSSEKNYVFNPVCKSTTAGGSLSGIIIKATLIIVGSDDRSFSGDSPNLPPVADGSVHGNFMYLSATSGLTPSNTSYSGGTNGSTDSRFSTTANFTEIWQDLLSGLYLTNILYNGSASTKWYGGEQLCLAINSGDGVGKWRLPTGEELCGSSYTGQICNGGVYAHGIKFATFAGGDWDSAFFWSSTAFAGGNSSNAWYANLSFGFSLYTEKSISPYGGVLCVR